MRLIDAFIATMKVIVQEIYHTAKSVVTMC